ncbi:MAG: DNA primase [Patescibacteria group bacterium]
MSSSTEEIKERLPITDVVSSYIKLERAGANLKARCPFHNEKTPSFIVSPSRNTYHCFGCNRGGDIFSFVEEIEGVDFKRALEILADRAGVVLERARPELKSAEQRAYGVLEEATLFFQSNLNKNKEALDYIKSRGLSDESIEKWRLGYAENGWRGLLSHLKEKKYSEIETEYAGLIIKNDKGYYDRFRGRIIFPVANAQGKIVGFSGRHFINKDSLESDTAKYINSPETALYNKSRVLYGFDKAKQTIMREDSAILVEGQVDLVMSHQVGLKNTVASSGTALTEEHLKMLKRFTDNIVMAFDGDEAGLAASERGFNLALSFGMDVRVAKIPLNTDPAELAAKDPDALIKAVKTAKHIIDFYLDSLLERGYDARRLKTEVGKRVLPYIAMVHNRIDQAHFVGIVAKALGLGEEPVWEEVKKIEMKIFEVKKEEKYTETPATKKEKICDKIAGILYWQEEKETKERQIDISKGRERFKVLSDGAPIDEAKKKDLILQAEVHYQGSENLATELERLFLNLEQELLEGELKKVMADLRLAEGVKDEEKARTALEKFHQISKKINEIKQKFKYA